MEWKTVKLGEVCKIFTGKKDVNQTIKDVEENFQNIVKYSSVIRGGL